MAKYTRIHSIISQPQDEEIKKGNAEERPDYHTDGLISHANNVMLKILQARFQQYVNQELPDVLGLEMA